MSSLLTLILTVFLGFAAVSAVKTGRVIGGGEVKLGDYPWQAAIYYGDIYICSGSLISDKHILTTRNCLEPYEFYPQLLNVHMGVLVAGDAKNRREGLKISLAAQSPSMMDVIAILEFDEPVIIGNGKEMMAITAQRTVPLNNMDEVQLSGWGMDDDTIFYHLQAVELHIEAISSVCAVDGTKPLCTFGIDLPTMDRVGPCKWDEGSALIKYEDSLNDYVVIGVVKHTNTCSGPIAKESKYIPVEQFLEFINDIIHPGKKIV